MTNLYLIAHRVRGEPAFDIATRMECPECAAQGCNECDDSGFWWIIPTSGHRAYPYHWSALSETDLAYIHAMPPDLPDHYPHALATDAPKRNLIDLLNLRPKSASTTPFPRRI